MQIACIGVIALSLAGPVLTLNPGRTALVFDISASMDAREDDGSTRLEAARARAKTMIRELPRFARVRVILARTVPRQVGEWAASDDLLLHAIDTLAATAGAGDVMAAIELAAAGADITNVIAFTDTESPAATDGVEGPRVQWVRLGHTADNAAVSHVSARRTGLGGRGGTVLVAIRNYAMKAREARVEISSDRRVAQRRDVQLPPDGSETIEVDLPDLGHSVSAILVGSDALSIDDSRSAVVPAGSATRVMLIGLGGSFLERALEANPSLSVHRYDEAAAARLGSTERFDVLVCETCDESAEADIPSLNVVDGSGEPVRDVVRVVSTAHPLARNLEPGWQRATVASPASISDAGEIVLRVGGTPVVHALERNGQRRVLMHRDLTESEFVLSVGFPVLVANAVEWLAAGHATPVDVTAGEPLTFTLPTTREHRLRVLGPDGRPRSFRREGARYIVADTDTAGLYRVEVDGLQRLVAVNPNVETESDLSTNQNASVAEFTTSAPSRRTPSSLASLLLLLAVVLLAFEWRLRVRGA